MLFVHEMYVRSKTFLTSCWYFYFLMFLTNTSWIVGCVVIFWSFFGSISVAVPYYFSLLIVIGTPFFGIFWGSHYFSCWYLFSWYVFLNIFINFVFIWTQMNNCFRFHWEFHFNCWHFMKQIWICCYLYLSILPWPQKKVQIT